ncbi:ROK family transcriptional regulator [Bacteroidales bacterium]|nr:ROK family transcriptional regulator [Bacteroidales bacterium]
MDPLIQIGSSEYIYRLNKKTILNLIRQEGQISRADIVKKTGISASTVTRIVDSLINEDGLAEQVGTGQSSGGRRPILVRFKGVNSYVIGVDWGRTHIYAVLSNLEGEHILETDLKTESDSEFESDLNKLVKVLGDLIDKSKVNKKKILGVGVAAAGYLNKDSGLIEFSANFNWRDVDVKTPLEERIGIPVIIDNVSRVMALGELYYGEGHKYLNSLFVNVGYGIGAGLILEGKPYYGTSGLTGEMGHNIVDPKSKVQCKCGRYGCLETISSGRGIARQAKEYISKNPNCTLAKIISDSKDKISAKIIIEAANQGDEGATAIIKKAGFILGQSIARMINLMNPDAVFLGGGVVLAGDMFINAIKQGAEEFTIPEAFKYCKILTATNGADAAVLGAISLILNEVLELNDL